MGVGVMAGIIAHAGLRMLATSDTFSTP